MTWLLLANLAGFLLLAALLVFLVGKRPEATPVLPPTLTPAPAPAESGVGPALNFLRPLTPQERAQMTPQEQQVWAVRLMWQWADRLPHDVRNDVLRAMGIGGGTPISQDDLERQRRAVLLLKDWIDRQPEDVRKDLAAYTARNDRRAEVSSPETGEEPTLTVTGLKNFDYASLKEKPYLEVLQMANEDVTDKTLEYLKGMTKLRQLDLSNTQVTDGGLKALKELPKLEVLQLSGTKVTDEGIRQHLFPLESLMELSVWRTKVTRPTRQQWRDSKQGRKVAPVF
jgi:hypothetical protein